MHALGISLLVGGAAFLLSGLVFLLPAGRKPSSEPETLEESQAQIEFHLEQLRKRRNEF